MDVSFGEPTRLYALWALVPFALALFAGRSGRARDAERLLDAPMRARLLPERRGGRAAAPAVLLVLSLACLVVAAARPRFGTTYEKIQQRGADLVVVLDVSRSMLSRDVHPSRLERSKAYVRDLLARAGGHRVGLVVFAGRPVVACPMTADLQFFESVLAEVSPDSAPRGGTVIGDALRMAVDVLDPMPDRDQAFVLITDGEDQDSFPLEAAAAAAERGVRIFTVGIGDPDEGARIPVANADSSAGASRYVTFEGKEVVSRMDEQLLQDIARETRGAYVPARTGTYDLGAVYVEHLADLRAGALREEERRRQKEQFQLFAGLGLALLLVSMLIRPTASRATRIGAAALLLALPFPAGVAAAADGTVEGVRTFNRAVERLSQGDVDAAVLLFDEAGELLPEQPLVKFGRGVAEQRRGALDVAEASYAAAARSGDARATAWARYNLGTVEVENAKAAFRGPAEDAVGDAREEGTAAIERAIQEFRAALRVDPEFEEARYNLELLRVWLKHIRDVWARKDAEESEQESPPPQEDPIALLLELLDEQQRLEDAGREGTSTPEAPERQAGIGTRIGAVKDLLSATLDQKASQATQAHPPAGGAGPGGALPEEVEAQLAEAREALLVPLDRAAEASARAADALADGEIAAAATDQSAVRDALASVWGTLADPAKLVEGALERQDEVLERTDAHAAEADPSAAAAAAIGTAQRQEFVARAAVLLGAKSEAAGAQVAQLLDQPIPDGVDDATRAQLEEQRASLEAIRPMLEKAAENAPRIPPLAASAVERLEAAAYAEAKPPEEEIRRLLEEIRALAPPPPEQPEQPEQSEQPDPSDQDQEEEQDSKSEDAEKQDEPQDGEQERPENPPDDGDPKDASEPPPAPEPGEPPPDGKSPQDPRQLSPQQVEALLKRALDREKELKEKEKALERILAVPVPVEKDW